MKANFSFLQSALNLRSWFTLSLQSAASRLNVVLLRELAVVLHLVKLLLCFFHQLQDVLIQLQGNANFLPVFLQELEQTWTLLSTQPPSLPQDPTWQQRLAIPVKQMNEVMFRWNKAHLKTPQNFHQQSPIASRESQLEGSFPDGVLARAGGQQLQPFSRKSSRLWKWAKLKYFNFWLSGVTS